jgi:hypothetical protein
MMADFFCNVVWSSLSLALAVFPRRFLTVLFWSGIGVDFSSAFLKYLRFRVERVVYRVRVGRVLLLSGFVFRAMMPPLSI